MEGLRKYKKNSWTPTTVWGLPRRGGWREVKKGTGGIKGKGRILDWGW